MRALALTVCAAACARAAVVPVVTAWGPNSARIAWAAPGYPDPAPFGPFPDAPTNRSARHAVSSGAAVTVASATGSSLVNGNLRVDVDAGTGLINVTRVSDGALLLTQSYLTFAPCVVPGAPPSAQLALQGPATQETIVGFGEQGFQPRVTVPLPFNRTFSQTEYYPYNFGRQAFVPLFFSSAGYGILFAFQGYGSLSVCGYGGECPAGPGIVANASSVRVVEVWVTVTPTTPVYSNSTPHPFLSLLEQTGDALGFPQPMPAFSTGFIASKDRYNTQAQLLDVAHGYVNRSIPISMLTVDWFHWANLGDMSLKPECWPDPGGMVAELEGLGIVTMVTHWPFMSPSSVHRSEYELAGDLALNRTSGTPDLFWEYLQNGSLIMPFTAEARNRTFSNWWQGYGQFGVRAVWLDETEPDRAAFSYGEWMYQNYTDLEVGVAWKSMWIRTMTDGLRAAYGVGNYFLLSRSGWAGTPTHGHAMWSGDTRSDWPTFAQQIPTGLGAGLSGFGMWTHDIGGYIPTMQPLDPSLQELYVRWFQFGSVSPLMRLHGHRNGGPPPDPVCMQTNGDNEPWTLVNTTEAYDAIVSAIRFRDQQRNYVADLQAAWAATNAPVIAPLWLLFPGDPVCGFTTDGSEPACSDHFMFGPDFLARPVTQLGVRTTWTYLPALPTGQTWMNWFSGANLGAGGLNVTAVPCPLSEFPLFYRQRA